jgi:hypothetical protein
MMSAHCMPRILSRAMQSGGAVEVVPVGAVMRRTRESHAHHLWIESSPQISSREASRVSCTPRYG